jgi:hypothetical protein
MITTIFYSEIQTTKATVFKRCFELVDYRSARRNSLVFGQIVKVV